MARDLGQSLPQQPGNIQENRENKLLMYVRQFCTQTLPPMSSCACVHPSLFIFVASQAVSFGDFYLSNFPRSSVISFLHFNSIANAKDFVRVVVHSVYYFNVAATVIALVS